MFVPHTPNSELKKNLTEMENGLGFVGKVRYCETMGPTVEDILVKKDPWSLHCKRDKCFPCRTKPGKCFKKNITYNVICLNCKEGGEKTLYIGETARTGYDRGVEHLDSLKRGDEGNGLAKHKNESGHDKYSMEIIRSHRTPLYRQSHEGCLIADTDNEINLLNSRGDWGQNLPPKLVIESECLSADRQESYVKKLAKSILNHHSRGGGNEEGGAPEGMGGRRGG